MKLYFAAGTCSIGIHVLLEEIGAPYETQKLSFADQEQTKPPFINLNPKGKVPVLVTNDGTVLTEWPAIAYWLARTNAPTKLLPDDALQQARVLEIVDYVVGTLHGQGFARLFRPENFAPNEADRDAVKARGKELVEKGLGLLDRRIGDRDYALGTAFSIADAALFYVEFWATARLKLALPPNLTRHYAKLTQRPAVQRVLAREGFA